MEVVKDFIFLGSKIIVDGNYSQEIKRCLLFGRKAMTNLDSVLESRDISLLIDSLIVKAMFFPVVMYECESQIIKKADHWRTDVFELWCWRTLGSALDCKEIKPVSPKENELWIIIQRSTAEAEALIIWLLDAKSLLIGKDLDAGKE